MAETSGAQLCGSGGTARYALVLPAANNSSGLAAGSVTQRISRTGSRPIPARQRSARDHLRGTGIGGGLQIADIGQAFGTQQLLGGVLRSEADAGIMHQSDRRRLR